MMDLEFTEDITFEYVMLLRDRLQFFAPSIKQI